jgi:hypothetical protein
MTVREHRCASQTIIAISDIPISDPIPDIRGRPQHRASPVEQIMPIDSDAIRRIDRVVPQWRPYTGALLPAWIAGRVRALREAEDDAQTVLSFLLTGLATRAVDPAEPLWVIDLAPAEGERAWRVLRALSTRAPRGPPIRYLARCGDAEHHARLSAHPLLKPVIASGDLFLDRSGRGIPPQTLRNPIAVLAHEGVSSQPQGLYSARGGELLEAWCDGDEGIEWRPTAQRDGILRLLSTCLRSLDGAAFTLPRGAMDMLSALLKASGGRMLLRASDKGAREIAQIRRGVLAHECDEASDRNAPRALRVNFEALARWHLAHGASVQQSQRDDDGRVLHVALHDVAGGRLQECLPEIIGLPHPDDHVQLLLALEALSAVSPMQCLALLRAQAGDSRALRALSKHVSRIAPAIEGAALNQWRDLLAYCRIQHYPPSDRDNERNEIPALIATLLSEMQEPHSADATAAVTTSPDIGGVPRA